MKKLFQEHILKTSFIQSLEREQLLVSKYKTYIKIVTAKGLKTILNDFIKDADNHIKILKDKMINLNIG